MDNNRYLVSELQKFFTWFALVGLRSFLKVELGVLPLGQAAFIGAFEWEGTDFD
jgi:hypothetical protein